MSDEPRRYDEAMGCINSGEPVADTARTARTAMSANRRIDGMRKSSTALIAVGALAAAACTGFAAEEAKPLVFLDPKIYGQLHVSLDQIDNESARDLYLSSDSSRLGFKGSAAFDAESKVKLIWQIEALVSVDETTNTVFVSRNTFVGIECPVGGTILAGRNDTPFKLLVSKVDLFNDRLGDAANLTAPGGKGWDLRTENTVQYATPSLGGLKVTASHSLKEENNQKDLTSASAIWEPKGALKGFFVGAGYETHGKMLTASTNSEPSAANEEGYRAIAGFSNARFSVAGVAQQLDNVGGKEDTDASVLGGMASVTFGKEVIKAQYLVRDDEGTTAGADMLAVGMDHNINERTTLYVAYAAVENKSGSSYSVAGDGHTENPKPAKGNDPQGIGLGIIYKF
jgi:predicted porin